jgi:hypothetical protein
MPLAGIASSAHQKVKPMRQLLQHLRRREHPCARRGQLDSERDTLQAAAQGGNGGSVVGDDLEVRPHRLGAVHEELNAGSLVDLFQISQAVRGGKRMHQKLPLAFQVESLARGREDGQGGDSVPQHAHQVCAAFQQMLHVVQHEQRWPGGQSLDDLLDGFSGRRGRQAQRIPDGIGNSPAVAKVGKRHEPDRRLVRIH